MSALRTGVIFPGQGSQSVGMGAGLADRHPVVGELFERAQRVLGYDLAAVIRDGPDTKLTQTQFAQPAIFFIGYAVAVAAHPALQPVAGAGHSFAELCALTLARALTFDAALELVRERGLAMQAAAEVAPGAMSAILGLDEAKVREAVSRAKEHGRVQLANFNAPAQIVISGDAAAVARAGEVASELGAKRVVALNVSGAWHSELMLPARERYSPFVDRAPLQMPAFTVISNVDAQPYRDVETIRENLKRSVTDEVRWHAASERLIAEGLDLIVECGGQAVLAPMLRRVENAPKSLHAGDAKGLEKLEAALSAGAVT